jgi:hypothetical protein
MLLSDYLLMAPETSYERKKQGVRSKDHAHQAGSPVLIRNPASKLRNILRAPVVWF